MSAPLRCRFSGRTPVPFAILRPDPLAYLEFNTISNLTTQDSQVDCFRYVWPAELDLDGAAGRTAAARALERLDGTPFTSESTGHVSVWEKARGGDTRVECVIQAVLTPDLPFAI